MNPIIFPKGWILVRKRDIVCNSAAFAIATEALAGITKTGDAKQWQEEIIMKAREKTDKYTEAEVDELFQDCAALKQEQ